MRVNQILLNLLGNAIKFTPEGGSIQIAMYEEDSPVSAEHVRLHLRVKDNGIGMDKEFKERIFESFSREDSARVQKTEGSGLGMAITKYIIDAMKGSIEVESELGKGTEFHVVLDFERAQEQMSAQEEEIIRERGEISFVGRRILFAEDNDLNWEISEELLSELGLELERAEDGKICVDMFEKSDQGYYDAILMDIRMPRMTGYEATQAIRELDRADAKTVPIIAQSADAFSEDVQKCMDSGMNAHIAKPIDMDEITRLLERYLL